MQLFVVGNSNPGLVTAQLDGTKLTLIYNQNLNGDSVITLQARDADGAVVETSFQVKVNQRAASLVQSTTSDWSVNPWVPELETSDSYNSVNEWSLAPSFGKIVNEISDVFGDSNIRDGNIDFNDTDSKFLTDDVLNDSDPLTEDLLNVESDELAMLEDSSSDISQGTLTNFNNAQGTGNMSNEFTDTMAVEQRLEDAIYRVQSMDVSGLRMGSEFSLISGFNGFGFEKMSLGSQEMNQLIDSLTNSENNSMDSIDRGLNLDQSYASTDQTDSLLQDNMMYLMLMDEVPIADVGCFTSFSATTSVIKAQQTSSEKNKN